MTIRTPSWRLVAVVTAAFAAAACGSSSTGPSGPTAAQTAEHIDSIFAADLAGGTESDSELAYAIAEYIEPAPAYGATQTSFTVTTASGAQTWQGFVIESEEMGDTVFVTAAYPANSNLSNFLLTLTAYDSLGEVDSIAFVAYDSAGTIKSVLASGTPTVSNAVTSVGAACSLQSGLAADSVITALTGSATSCNVINTTYSMSAQFSAPALPAADASLSISAVPIHGVQLGGTLLGYDRAPRGPTIASARIQQLIAAIRRRGSR
jgi:hypothetical protein